MGTGNGKELGETLDISLLDRLPTHTLPPSLWFLPLIFHMIVTLPEVEAAQRKIVGETLDTFWLDRLHEQKFSLRFTSCCRPKDPQRDSYPVFYRAADGIVFGETYFVWIAVVKSPLFLPPPPSVLPLTTDSELLHGVVFVPCVKMLLEKLLTCGWILFIYTFFWQRVTDQGKKLMEKIQNL